MANSAFGVLAPPKLYEYFQGPPMIQRLDAFISGKSAAKTQKLIEFGAVYVNHKRIIDPGFMIGPEDVIRVHLKPKRYILDKEKIQNQIVFENNNFIVVNKPSGLPMHPTLDNLYENLLYAFEVPVYVTHRLDVPTSGLVLVAKTKDYQRQFNNLLSHREVEKIYEATTTKGLALGELVHFMKNSIKAPKVFALKPSEDITVPATWFECRLNILSSEKNLDDTFKITVSLLTGRTHQIRGQLALEGAPILGDEMYGGKSHSTFGLRAAQLSFICPVEGKEMLFKLTT